MSGIVKAFMVPGLPHLHAQLQSVWDNEPATRTGNPWATISNAMAQAAQMALAAEPDVIVIYSAQWVSILGHSFQFAGNPNGTHVDENWHELGAFPFSFSIDKALTQQIESKARTQGFSTRLVDYEGFPIDTGSLITLSHFNPLNRIPVVILSSNIYATAEDSYHLGLAVRQAAQESGKRAVVINCSSLSHRFLPEWVTSQTDRFASVADDKWNQRFLEMVKRGENRELMAWAPEYVSLAGPEMGLKGFYWMMGAMNAAPVPAEMLAYGPLWGTGAAVLAYSLN